MAKSQLVMYARDLKRMVDAERQRANELAEANSRLRQLDQAKTDFLTFISHQLRSPLTALVAIDLLDPESSLAEQAEFIDLMRQGRERLERFVMKGLEYFQWLSKDRLESPALVDVVVVVQLVIACRQDLTAPEVEFQFLHPRVPCWVHGDEYSLTQVLRILLDNAMTYSPAQKRIQVEVRCTHDQVVLTVTDQGQGFLPEFAETIFQPFASTDLDHYGHGAGLNLPLARAIINAHGGKLWGVSAGRDKGASFILTLPGVSASEEFPVS
jgi:signal transduction histidine kinase